MVRSDALQRVTHAFTADAAVMIEDEPGKMTLETLGFLTVTSGRVTVAEPDRLGDSHPNSAGNVPFAYEFPRGRFPAVLSMFVPDSTTRNLLPCYLQVQFADRPVARFEGARFANQAPDDRELLAFGTDTASGALVDADGVALIRTDRDALLERVQDKLNDSYSGGEVVLRRDPEVTLIVFPTNGDGGYPSFVGFDAAGAAIAIVIDLLNVAYELSLWNDE